MPTTIRAVADTSAPGATRTNGHDDIGIPANASGPRMTYSRVIGALFLLGFLFYGVAVGSLLIQWNNVAYSIGEATLGVGGLFLCAVLYRSRLIPRLLAVVGSIGYVSLTVGMVAEIFGIHIGLMLSVPGIFFEVGLPLWLFSKGFEPEAYTGRAEILTTVRSALATS